MRKFLSDLLPSILRNSEASEGSQPHNLSLIQSHAGNITNLASGDAALADRLDRLEVIIEEAGQENEFRTELFEYVKDLRDEAKFIKTARLIFGGLAVIVCVFCFVEPVVIAFKQWPWFLALPEYPKTALIIGPLAAGVLILQNLVKAVYRSAAERQADEFIPPPLKLIHEMMSGGKEAKGG